MTKTITGRAYENKLIERIIMLKKFMPKMDTAKLIFYITTEGYGK